MIFRRKKTELRGMLDPRDLVRNEQQKREQMKKREEYKRRLLALEADIQRGGR